MQKFLASGYCFVFRVDTCETCSGRCLACCDVWFSCPPASTRPSILLFVVLSQTGSYDGKSLLQVGRVDSLESEGESSLNRVNSVSFSTITIMSNTFTNCTS